MLLSEEQLRTQFAILSYCASVLEERKHNDPADAMLWAIKKKVARYAINRITMDLPSEPSESQLQLTEREKTRILKTHPLLQPEKHISSQMRVDPQWLNRVRRRMWNFNPALKGKHA